MTAICHYVFFQTHRTPRLNLKASYRPLVIMMCQFNSILARKYTTLMSDVDNRGRYACVWTGAHGKFLYLPLNCVVTLKLL